MSVALGLPTVASMPARTLGIAAVLASALALAAVPAFASLGSEVAQGQKIAGQLQSGTTSCTKLSAADFEHLGEYVMERMVGSSAAHQAMNDRMESMIGSQSADRMHESIGRRFAGCPGGSVAGGMMGGGMMGGGMMGSGSAGWGAMMSRAGWSWMRDGSWQHMSRAQWRDTASSMTGGGWMMGTSHHSGWSGGAVVGAVLLALLAGGLIVFVLVRSGRRPHAAT